MNEVTKRPLISVGASDTNLQTLRASLTNAIARVKALEDFAR